jgi:hypothetical protein
LWKAKKEADQQWYPMILNIIDQRLMKKP